MPGIWDEYLDQFQKLLVLRCLRGDKVTNAMQDFVATNLEPRFIEPQASAISQCPGPIPTYGSQGTGYTFTDHFAAMVRVELIVMPSKDSGRLRAPPGSFSESSLEAPGPPALPWSLPFLSPR